MKRKIALFLVVAMVAALFMSFGTASAAGSTTRITFNYIDYYTNNTVTAYTLTPYVDITYGRTFYYNEIVAPGYTLMSASPAYITYDGRDHSMTIKVRSDADSYYYNGYSYYNYGTYYDGTGRVISMGDGTYLYESIELANPLLPMSVGSMLYLTSGHLGGLSPTNTHLTFSTSDSNIAYTAGPIIIGKSAGTAKLYVYYNGTMVIIKDIVVTATSSTSSGSIVSTDGDLVIGPATFTAAKGKSYKFTKIKLEGQTISASSLKWGSSNTKIATVSKSGIVRTKKAGSVIITASTSDGDYSTSIKFIVK